MLTKTGEQQQQQQRDTRISHMGSIARATDSNSSKLNRGADMLNVDVNFE